MWPISLMNNQSGEEVLFAQRYGITGQLAEAGSLPRVDPRNRILFVCFSSPGAGAVPWCLTRHSTL